MTTAWFPSPLASEAGRGVTAGPVILSDGARSRRVDQGDRLFHVGPPKEIFAAAVILGFWRIL